MYVTIYIVIKAKCIYEYKALLHGQLLYVCGAWRTKMDFTKFGLDLFSRYILQFHRDPIKYYLVILPSQSLTLKILYIKDVSFKVFVHDLCQHIKRHKFIYCKF